MLDIAVIEAIAYVLAALGLGAGAGPAYKRLRNGRSNGEHSLAKQFTHTTDIMLRLTSSHEKMVGSLEHIEGRIDTLVEKQDRAIQQNHDLMMLHQNPDAPFSTVEIQRRLPAIEKTLEALGQSTNRIENKLNK